MHISRIWALCVPVMKPFYAMDSTRSKKSFFRQIDNVTFSSKLESTIRKLGAELGIKVKLFWKMVWWNTTFSWNKEINQNALCILSEKIMDNHRWKAPSKTETRMVEPFRPSVLKENETTRGPSHERESKTLETEMGFTCRPTFEELKYAHVTWRLDIGYVIAELSKFSACPARYHHTRIKQFSDAYHERN